MNSYRPSLFPTTLPHPVTRRRATGMAAAMLLHVPLLARWHMARLPHRSPSRTPPRSVNSPCSAGAIDRALRQEHRPYSLAPLDSPQIRMRNRMERAHATAAPALREAPVVEELVNQTGDGTRRERVITGKRTCCITARSPATSVEMIEHHGQHTWRTARD